jgi:hypothetical protein
MCGYVSMFFLCGKKNTASFLFHCAGIVLIFPNDDIGPALGILRNFSFPGLWLDKLAHLPGAIQGLTLSGS